MWPTPIPEDEIPEGFRRAVVGPPRDPDASLVDELTGAIRPVEMLVGGEYVGGVRTMSARFELEEGDLEKLTAGVPVWLTLWGGVPPFEVRVGFPEVEDEGDGEPH